MNYFSSDIVTFSDYYPFGMLMPERNGGENYTFGYQGSEKDDEVKGKGNSYTTFYRQLDPRLGRWLSIDPATSSLPWQSPYVSMDNSPVLLNDPYGDETDDWFKYTDCNGSEQVYWDNETGSLGSKINRTIDGQQQELINIGRTISIETNSSIRIPNDIALPNTEGTKLTTFYSIRGDYNDAGKFIGFTNSFNRETGKTFGIDMMEGTEGVQGTTNSVNNLHALQFKGQSVFPILGSLEQHTQVPHIEALGLKEYTSGYVVDVNQVVSILLSPSFDGMHKLNLLVSHGTFPSVSMNINYNNGLNSSTIYRYQQNSFALTHGRKTSLAYMYSAMSGSGQKAIELQSKLNSSFKWTNSPWVQFQGFNAGTFLYNPKTNTRTE